MSPAELAALECARAVRAVYEAHRHEGIETCPVCRRVPHLSWCFWADVLRAEAALERVGETGGEAA
jgi:hypothetical protein